MHIMPDRSTSQSFADYRDEAWQVSLFRLVLIALLAASLAAGPALIRTGLGFAWPVYLIPAAAIAGALGVVTTSLLGRPAWRDRRGMTFRLGEVVLMAAEVTDVLDRAVNRPAAGVAFASWSSG